MLHLRLLIYSLLILPTWSILPDDDSSCVHRCFNQPAESCPSPGSTCRCRQLPNCKRAAVCCDVNKFQLTEGLGCGNINADGQVDALHIRNASLEVLNLTQPVWRRLRYMTITDGQINSVVGEFAKHTIVSCLNLSNNGIKEFEHRSLVNLFNLSVLDLSYNNLSDVPRFKKEGNVTLDISNNTKMLCSSLSEALNSSEINFMNENNTFCLSSLITFNWFKSVDKVPLSEVIRNHSLQQNCFQRCNCVVERLQFIGGDVRPTYVVAVNCSGSNMASLPVPLPPYTISLDISNNNITSLTELSHPSYHSLQNLYADNNRISSIQPLEGTKFMNNFVKLSLRNNSIKLLETYLLHNIFQFQRSYNEKKVNLGLNNLHCDCNTAKDLKVWLLTKQAHIPDFDQIGCDNMDLKVTELNPSKLCQISQDWTDYIYYIITAEVLLLVGLIAKVSYDYWVFKTAGYLPWPASKMPRLPCDWLCE